MRDIIDNLTRRVDQNAMQFCAKVAAMHENEFKSEEYNKAARDIAAKILELAGSDAPAGRAA